MHRVKCYYCNEIFDRDKVPDYVQISARRYAHTECHNQFENSRSQEEKDKIALESYIIKLLNLPNINARIRKQIKDFLGEGYTYTGIHKTLVYFYEIKDGDIEKANGGIGIVPYVYKEAQEYYYNIWMARQVNEAKPINQFVKTEETIITIEPPKRKKKKRNLFSFLDGE